MEHDAENDEKFGFNSLPLILVACVECGQRFDKPVGSRRIVCTEACKRERGRRYSREYSKQGREARAKILDHFGGRVPSAEQIFQLLQLRKGSKP